MNPLLPIFAALALPLGSAIAQDYPTRPVNVIVPAAAGGPTDSISRITAQAMSKVLGQQITIENAGGATMSVWPQPPRSTESCPMTPGRHSRPSAW
jgi:tripartite-type tricarboxylate transporter receptor subunit TctC